jgi:ABC-type transport system involved in cytochrome bd biosynthesis fused ATPase/permease subunit
VPLVELRAVVLRRPRSDFALGPLTLSLQRGERLAVVGPTGCGKSTLLIALLGYLRPSGGMLALGGEWSETADLATWRQQLSWMPQAPAIVTGSVLANVTLTSEDGPTEAGFAAIGLSGIGLAGIGFADKAASALRHAGAEELVASLGGLDATLREGGSGLSSGERQRIGLARALCRRADLYLLDEPTAHLDARIEQHVVTGIFDATASSALVVVTHSPAVAARCDRVLDLGSEHEIVSRPSWSGLSGLLTGMPGRA